jgi:hypothetical protein
VGSPNPGLYRNSASGNPDNRGLDSDFARVTYVPTSLDTALLPDIVALKKRLMRLTGNPGDGKTGFLEKVRDELKMRGARVTREDRYGWQLEHAGKNSEAIFDASESRGERTDAETLRLALAPLAGDSAPDLALLPTLLIAINDGRFHKFLNSERQSFTWLADTIRRLIFEDAAADNYVEIVDLKRRALVQLPGKSGSLLSRMLAGLVDAPRWGHARVAVRVKVVPLSSMQIVSPTYKFHRASSICS